MQHRCQGGNLDQRQFQMKCWLYLLPKVFNDCEALIGILLMSFYYLDVKIQPNQLRVIQKEFSSKPEMTRRQAVDSIDNAVRRADKAMFDLAGRVQ
ncbi:hypothetical protein SAMN05428978_100728 [Nitrosomonas sp. Nm34]|nr:hypothetical protein SAMN05428978_100728 [Nitrosomonas sp. Nm34]